MEQIRLITLDPGHFHAALIQKEMYPGISPDVSVYGPLTPDLVEHLARIARFNARAANPTDWRLAVQAAPDYLERMLAARDGNGVVRAGKNRRKIDYIEAAVGAGLNVLADKPWIIRSADLPRLERVLEEAGSRGLIAYDIMTERFEITTMLQRELVSDAEVFGELVPGSAAEPGVCMKSVHNIMKLVAGVPLRRPAWFFDVLEQGEGLSDVGTHLVDMAQWTLFPEQPVDYRESVEIHGAKRWPTVMTRAEFKQVTGEDGFPEYLRHCTAGDQLEYFCNNQVTYSVRGVFVKLDVLWDYQAPAGAGDSHHAVYRGTRSRVEVRQGPAEKYRPELYVVPNRADDLPALRAAVARRVKALAEQYPGVSLEPHGGEVLVTAPDALRVGHEAHFAQVASQFFRYVRGEEKLPAWEKPNMLAKYCVSTTGVEICQ